MDELKRARAAKEKVRALAAAACEVIGVGITMAGGRYAVKLSLLREPADPAAIPAEVDGVPVIWRVVGRVKKQRLGEDL